MMEELGIEAVKRIQLEILSAVDLWCREHNVGYFLDCGTLLGAVRHKGYIPWDDDIDISMLREDYEFFIENFNKGRSDSLEALHLRKNKGFPYEFAKIHDKKTLMVENVEYGYDMGVNIDLFVIDYIADDYGTAVRRNRKLYRKLRFPIFALGWKLTLGNRKKKRPLPKAAAVSFMKLITSPFSVGWCVRRMDEVAASYYDTGYSYMAAPSSRAYDGIKLYRREWVAETTDVEFEGMTFKAPKNYDAVLTLEYGDYMTPPPQEARVTHHEFRAYTR